MRRGMFTVLAGVIALLIPAAADAKSYQGNGEKTKAQTSSSRSHVKHSQKKHSQKKHSQAKHRQAKQGASKQRHSHESAGNSSGCLSSEARGLLRRLQSRFDVELISTCRPGARIATTGKVSKHASGQAIDFRVPGRKKEVVNWLINNHHSGGTMTYNDMDHIHVDVGYHFVALNRPSGH